MIVVGDTRSLPSAARVGFSKSRTRITSGDNELVAVAATLGHGLSSGACTRGLALLLRAVGGVLWRRRLCTPGWGFALGYLLPGRIRCWPRLATVVLCALWDGLGAGRANLLSPYPEAHSARRRCLGMEVCGTGVAVAWPRGFGSVIRRAVALSLCWGRRPMSLASGAWTACRLWRSGLFLRSKASSPRYLVGVLVHCTLYVVVAAFILKQVIIKVVRDVAFRWSVRHKMGAGLE